MGKTGKALLLSAAALTGAYLLVGEVLYEGVLNKKFTSYKNDRRKVTDETVKLYGAPEDQVDADAWFVAMNPDDTRVVNLQGNTMHANIIAQKEYTEKWAVVVHGYTSCPRSMAPQARYFYEKGFNVLLPHLVSFAEDEQSHCTMGYRDKDYVLEWTDYIASLDSEAKIVILGVSMGSATTMLVTGEEKLNSNVKCAVADCGYTSCWDECCSQIKSVIHLPWFPFVDAANTVSKLRGSFDFKKNSPVEAVARSKTPTLFIHGERDDFVPYWMLDKVFDACTAEKEKLSVPDACHSESCDVHPELYYPAIDSFLERYFY